jgi:hypothetical protein
VLRGGELNLELAAFAVELLVLYPEKLFVLFDLRAGLCGLRVNHPSSNSKYRSNHKIRDSFWVACTLPRVGSHVVLANMTTSVQLQTNYGDASLTMMECCSLVAFVRTRK